jgi:hypothetical protein
MENLSKISKKIQLVFPRLKEQDLQISQDLSQYKDRKFFDLFEIDINELFAWSGGFRVESIEVFANSIISSNDHTKLIVGGRQDQKGVTLLLKPNDKMAIEPGLHKSKNFGGG